MQQSRPNPGTPNPEAAYFGEESAHRGSGYGPLFFIATCVLFLVEVILAQWTVHAVIPLGFALALHFLAVMLPLFWAITARRVGRPAHFPLLLAITSAFLGPFGAGGCLLMLILRTLYTARSFEEWFSTIFPEDRVTEGEKLAELLERYQRALATLGRVVPFREVLMLGSVRQKQDMVGMIGRQFHPSLSPALKLALKDDSNAVRVQAATAISKVENAFLKEAMELEEAYLQDPKNIKVIRALAGFYDAYAFTGVLDPDREIENRDKALQYYLLYLEQHPEDARACLSVGRIYFRNGDYARASDWIESCLERGIATSAMITWLMESNYHLRRFDTLQRLATTYQNLVENSKEMTPEVREAVAFWSKNASRMEV